MPYRLLLTIAFAVLLVFVFLGRPLPFGPRNRDHSPSAPHAAPASSTAGAIISSGR